MTLVSFATAGVFVTLYLSLEANRVFSLSTVSCLNFKPAGQPAQAPYLLSALLPFQGKNHRGGIDRLSGEASLTACMSPLVLPDPLALSWQPHTPRDRADTCHMECCFR